MRGGARPAGPAVSGWAPHRIGGPATLSCDVLVIGSGAGGASVAATLVEAGRDVLMLDEGAHIDAARAPASVPESFRRMWRGGGILAALGTPPVAYAEGRCVGGGTEINSAIFQRAPDTLLDDWAKRYRIAEFGAVELGPYYDRAAKVVNATPPPPDAGLPTDILRRGGAALGWKVVELDRGTRRCVGTNYCSLGCPTGGKQSMTATQIPGALSGGLRLIADCRATRLRLRGGRVVEVTAQARGADGRRHRVVLRPREVFVCAGAIHSPALLRRSGLTRCVGDTLRLHPTLKATALFDEVLDAHDARLPLTAISEFMPDRRIGGSVTQPGLLAMSLAEDWAERSWLMPEWRRCGQYYTMIRAAGTGTVRPLPLAAEPLVRYALTEGDWTQLARGATELARVMFAAGARHVYPSIAGHPGWASPEEVLAQADAPLSRTRTSLMTIHLFSSLPPGERSDGVATDSFGRVSGVENLRIADASQIPEAPGVNPQATVMAMAYRNAEAFLAASGTETRRTAFRERSAA